MVHLAHRDEIIPTMGKDATTFYARAACGQTRGFNHEAEDVQCVGPDWVSEVECGRCLRIHEHWKRENSPESRALVEELKRSLSGGVAMKCEKPCSGCPWLAKNQTPEAIAASPVDGSGAHWFSTENILRHWKAAASIGAMLPCHATDDHAPLYGGKPTKHQDARICVGQSMLAWREVTAFMRSGQDFEKYRKIRGRRFSAVGLAAWAARLFYAGAVFHIGGRKFVMPKITNADSGVTLPWKDEVQNESVGAL